MKFLANENIPAASVELLRQQGFDITYIAEDFPSEKDIVVLKQAHLQKRIIVTFDRDYGELIFKFRHPPPPGVIYLRFEPNSPTEVGEMMTNILTIKNILWNGRFTVIERNGKIRQRLLP